MSECSSYIRGLLLVMCTRQEAHRVHVVQDTNVEAAREICASLQALLLESKGNQAIEYTQVCFPAYDL
jgi:hypothetical protein